MRFYGTITTQVVVLHKFNVVFGTKTSFFQVNEFRAKMTTFANACRRCNSEVIGFLVPPKKPYCKRFVCCLRLRTPYVHWAHENRVPYYQTPEWRRKRKPISCKACSAASGLPMRGSHACWRLSNETLRYIWLLLFVSSAVLSNHQSSFAEQANIEGIIWRQSS